MVVALKDELLVEVKDDLTMVVQETANGTRHEQARTRMHPASNIHRPMAHQQLTTCSVAQNHSLPISKCNHLQPMRDISIIKLTTIHSARATTRQRQYEHAITVIKWDTGNKSVTSCNANWLKMAINNTMRCRLKR